MEDNGSFFIVTSKTNTFWLLAFRVLILKSIAFFHLGPTSFVIFSLREKFMIKPPTHSFVFFHTSFTDSLGKINHSNEVVGFFLALDRQTGD